jgi:3-deoxy-manno-octulosonate cytidylyltransferase (CMP-KDO synthetase)
MFRHVFEEASRCSEITQVLLSRDDKRTIDFAKALYVLFFMTRSDHPCGTDRVLDAAKILKIPKDAVEENIQGYEPILKPAMLTELLFSFRTPKVQVTPCPAN